MRLLSKYEKRSPLATDRLSTMRQPYEQEGARRSNLCYGYAAG
jgi:hypothetical protein